ncbi:XRE family transcriptional regulator [Amycolatopsis sp. FDAARGOS 1241]|uniref:XRE family transcriptional regulator n=1 Tax=Amycolatopsis sp. FDAARGOS 1241 TaxID=2778070 RepID=UPI001951D1FC|nr:XRE family transcriptional regulator [Amycolatopsis sp. FDAARGOS 1241]QRP46907.1 XRE family transcriptional regulator [Amycolatopsis sp. FDAARGOS 1241]
MGYEVEEPTKLKRARTAAGWSQNEVCRRLSHARRARGQMPPKPESVLRQYRWWEQGKKKATEWQDELCEVFKASPHALGLAEEPAPSPLIIPTAAPTVADYGDAAYLDSARGDLARLVALDNRFGAADIVRMSYKFFKSLQNLVGTGAYDSSLEKDFNSLIGEVAELTGWLAYDAEIHKLVRLMNNESLLYTRLAGDRSIELLTLQNSSMHAGALGRPGEALRIAQSVLEGDYKLSPRLRALFLTRKARALAQAGDESSIALFGEIESLYLEGVQDGDPEWAWWIDERELAWHKAMATQALRQDSLAVIEFERSVEATAPTETRSQYLHRAYLLQAQVDAGSWNEVEITIKSLLPLIPEVESTRTKVLLREAIAKIGTQVNVPGKIQSGIAQLGIALDEADLTEAW